MRQHEVMNARVEITTLFVYGTLLKPDLRDGLLGRHVETIPARLVGYARGRKRYFFVTAEKGAETKGKILLRLTERDFQILDEYEELPALYNRVRVTVLDGAGNEIECWTYLPTDWAD